jgi:simple sugar transport system permease protein
LQRFFNLPDATVSVFQGILFIVILASETLYGRFAIFQRTNSPAPPGRSPSVGNVSSPSQAVA